MVLCARFSMMHAVCKTTYCGLCQHDLVSCKVVRRFYVKLFNLILTKTRNGIKEMNLDRLIYLYINKRIFNRPVGNTSSNSGGRHGYSVIWRNCYKKKMGWTEK